MYGRYCRSMTALVAAKADVRGMEWGVLDWLMPWLADHREAEVVLDPATDHATMRCVAGLPGVGSLYATCTAFDNEDLKAIAGVDDLILLDLSGTRIADLSVSSLPSTLRYFYANHTTINLSTPVSSPTFPSLISLQVEQHAS